MRIVKQRLLHLFPVAGSLVVLVALVVSIVLGATVVFFGVVDAGGGAAVVWRSSVDINDGLS